MMIVKALHLLDLLLVENFSFLSLSQSATDSVLILCSLFHSLQFYGLSDWVLERWIFCLFLSTPMDGKLKD